MPDITPPATTPASDFVAMLKDAWIPILVVLLIFIAHNIATGIDTGGAVIGAAAGVSVVGGHAAVARRPQLTPWRRRGMLAAISAGASVVALLLFHIFV